MKRLIPFLLLIPLVCLAQTFTRTAAFRGAAGVRPSTGITYLLSEDFETTDGATSGYDLTSWVEGGTGVKNADYTEVVIAGSQSLLHSNANTKYSTSQHNFASNDTVYVKCKFILTNGASVFPANAPMMRFYESGTAGNVVYAISVRTTGRIRAEDVGASHSASPALVLQSNTLYYVWGRYTKGTGANSIASVGIATNNVEPTTGDGFASLSNGNSTSQLGSIVLYSDSIHFIWDTLRVANVPIGSSE